MFFVTLLNQFYWFFGSTLGGVLGSFIHFNTEGLDFVLTDHTIQSHGTLLQWKQTLSPHGFVTPCRGFLVNMDFIHYICDTKLILTNGTELPLSRRQAREISDLFTKHMIIYGGNHGI